MNYKITLNYYKTAFLFISVFILTYFQAYWSMIKYKDVQSYALTSYDKEITIISVLVTITMLIVYFFTNKIKPLIKIQSLILFLGLLFLFFQTNKSIFIERHASWSTYTTGISIFVLQISYLHMAISSILFLGVLYLMHKMQFKKIIVFILLTIFLRFWFGVYADAEFGEKCLFIKHQPTWKWYFYSPLGMSDKTLDDLEPKLQKEEILFQKYVNY